MFDFLDKPLSGLVLLVILLAVTLIVSAYKKKHPVAAQETTDEELKDASPLNINDEDATVACLIAAIECRNEMHKNVQIISVREIN